MPGNSLSLTVRVSCEENFVCAFCLALKLLDNVTLAADIDVVRLKAVFNINTERALGQVTDMTLGSNYLVVRTKIAFYSISLCRRLNNY